MRYMNQLAARRIWETNMTTASTTEIEFALESAKALHPAKRVKLFTEAELKNLPGGWKPMKVGEARTSARRGALWECAACGEGWYVAVGIPRFARLQDGATGQDEQQH